MVETATSLGRSGLQDWLIQRISAVILAAYTAFMIIYFLIHPGLQYEQWHALFESNLMRYSSVLVLFSLVSHSWIGVWTIITDYIKPLALRLLVQVLFLIALLVCLFWGIRIIWSL